MILIPQFRNILETSGTLSIVHTDGDGNLKENRFYSNIVTTIGKQWLAARMKDSVAGHTIPAQMSKMALGGNATVGSAVVKTTPLVGDFVLSSGGAPALSELARQDLTIAGGSFPQGYGTGSPQPSTLNIPVTAVITYASTFAAGTGTGALVEAGIFNAASAGVMLCKTSFDVVNKQTADTIAITWTINIQ
jgi:hypothetical protein